MEPLAEPGKGGHPQVNASTGFIHWCLTSHTGACMSHMGCLWGEDLQVEVAVVPFWCWHWGHWWMTRSGCSIWYPRSDYPSGICNVPHLHKGSAMQNTDLVPHSAILWRALAVKARKVRLTNIKSTRTSSRHGHTSVTWSSAWGWEQKGTLMEVATMASGTLGLLMVRTNVFNGQCSTFHILVW